MHAKLLVFHLILMYRLAQPNHRLVGNYWFFDHMSCLICLVLKKLQLAGIVVDFPDACMDPSYIRFMYAVRLTVLGQPFINKILLPLMQGLLSPFESTRLTQKGSNCQLTC